MTGCHTNTATAPLSACHEVPNKTLPIQADLSWSPLPHVPLCAAAFFFFLLKLLYPAPILPCLSEPSPAIIGPETHGLQACLPLCPSSNRVLSLSIAIDTRPFLLILWPLSSTLLFLVCHMAILVNPARGILFAHCAFDVVLLPPRFPAN